MSTTSDYKTSKEAFVSGMSGSTIGHVNMISLVALSSIALHSSLRTRLPPSKPLSFPAEFLVLAVPLLLSVTIAANAPGLLNLVLIVATIGVLLMFPRRESGNVLPLGVSQTSSPNRDGQENGRARDVGVDEEEEDVRGMGRDGVALGITHIPLLPALTTYRAHMLLLTAICILAVDFQVFPRELAKCETFGVSLMDLGVGSFVFSQGVVSALPIIKNPLYLTTPFVPKFTTVLRKCLPLLLLGLLRTVSVKVLLHPLILYLPISLVGVIVALSHQLALSSGGLTSYVLNEPRESFISANKEGLVSLTGYLAIHLLGLSTGTLVLPPSPSYFRRQQDLLRQRQLQCLSPTSPTPSSTFPSVYDISSLNPSSSTASGVSPTRERPQSELERDFQFPPRSPTRSRRTSFDTSATDSPVLPTLTSFNSLNSLNVNSPSIPSRPSFDTHLSPYSPTSPNFSNEGGSPSPNPAQQGRRISTTTTPVKRENDRTAIELCSYAFLWWVSLGVSKLVGVGGGVSRRLVNLQYITYTIAFNTTFLLGYLLLDLLFFPSPLSKSVYSPVSGLKVTPAAAPAVGGEPNGSGRDSRIAGTSDVSTGSDTMVGGAPKLLDAINRNGLVLFLLANVATGLINLTIPTMYVTDGWAMVILTLYTFGMCAVAWGCRGRKLWRF
ncbi:unnamed protein product [Somion occarium]|uniref:GPI-anchored wall transfer protein 1 n=1 Tax=Somion occarium TaxID=3059160 RepID=A0ABP1DR90_9APHY